MPQEEPAGQNPPDGAMIDYYLAKNGTDISLEIVDAKGTVVRKYTSKDTLYTVPENNVPPYWLRPQQLLSGAAGSHRFLWDMHYTPLNLPVTFPIAATYKNTAPIATSPWVMPGNYKARLTVDGKIIVQSFEILLDPRIKTATNYLQLQHDVSLMCYKNIEQCIKAFSVADINSEKAKSLQKFRRSFTSIQEALQEGEWAPTKQMIESAKKTEQEFKVFMRK